MTIQVNDVLEEAAKDHIKKLFEIYILSKIDGDPSAKARFKNGIKLCMDALEELNG